MIKMIFGYICVGINNTKMFYDIITEFNHKLRKHIKGIMQDEISLDFPNFYHQESRGKDFYESTYKDLHKFFIRPTENVYNLIPRLITEGDYYYNDINLTPKKLFKSLFELVMDGFYDEEFTHDLKKKCVDYHLHKLSQSDLNIEHFDGLFDTKLENDLEIIKYDLKVLLSFYKKISYINDVNRDFYEIKINTIKDLTYLKEISLKKRKLIETCSLQIRSKLVNLSDISTTTIIDSSKMNLLDKFNEQCKSILNIIEQMKIEEKDTVEVIKQKYELIKEFKDVNETIISFCQQGWNNHYKDLFDMICSLQINFIFNKKIKEFQTNILHYHCKISNDVINYILLSYI